METSVATAVDTGTRSVFDVLLDPRSVALIGASTNPEALGGRPLGFLASYGYRGAVYPVNAKSDVVQGLPAYRSIADVPERVELAVVAVRAELVPGVLRECAAAGVDLAAVLSSGFGEGMGLGRELLAEVEADLARTPMRVLGPNCEGLASLPASAPMTFSPVLDVRRTGSTLKQGSIAIVSQSGGLGFAIAQWGTEVGLGYNYIVTTGNELDIDSLELAAHLADDPGTEVLVLVVEGFRDVTQLPVVADRFRAAGKRLVVAKLGQTEAGARGALAHTSHVAGDPIEYDELFRAHGVLQASDVDELIDLLQAITKARPPAGNRVGVVTTSGGAGVWLADALTAQGFAVPRLSEQTQAQLRAHMPSFGSPGNPVDLTAQFLASGSFVPPMRCLIDSGEVDLVVLTTSLSSAGRLAGDREALGRLVEESPVPIVVHSYTKPASSCVEILDELGVPWYTNPNRAARGLAGLIDGSLR